MAVNEGAVLAVPLPDGGAATAVVARANPLVFLGYFFRSRRVGRPEQAALVAIVGAGAVLSGEWPVTGTIRRFRRDHWVNPLFHNSMLEGPKVEVVGHSDDDLLQEVTVGTWRNADEARHFPVDSLYDPSAVTSRLVREAGRDPGYVLVPVEAVLALSGESSAPARDAVAAHQALVLHLRRRRMSSAARLHWEADVEARLTALDDRLRGAGSGEVDGWDADGTLLAVYCYGAAAEVLWEEAKSCLSGLDLAEGSRATLRFGAAQDLDAREESYDLAT